MVSLAALADDLAERASYDSGQPADMTIYRSQEGQGVYIATHPVPRETSDTEGLNTLNTVTPIPAVPSPPSPLLGQMSPEGLVDDLADSDLDSQRNWQDVTPARSVDQGA